MNHAGIARAPMGPLRGYGSGACGRLDGRRLEAELGYGLAALKGRGLLTPYARVALTEGPGHAVRFSRQPNVLRVVVKPEGS